MKPVIIFDFDGTIADSFDYVFGFLRTQAGLPEEFTAREAAPYHEMSMRKMAVNLGVPRWKLLFVYFKGRRAMRKHLQKVSPFDGMPEVISMLHKRGFKLYIVSANSGRNVHKFLRSNQLNSYFSTVKGNASMWGKASLLEKLITRHNINREQCWLIGDEVGDMLAARAVRIHGMAVGWGFADKTTLLAAADKVVMHPEDIVKLLG